MNYLIYPVVDGQYDRARWLTIDLIDSQNVVLNLQDLCHPGRLTNLYSVRCPLHSLMDVVVRGCIQITTQMGYLMIRTENEFSHLEFRGEEDHSPTRATMRSEDIARRIQSLTGSSSSAAAM